MSDGKLRYPVTVKTKDGLATQIIEKNGPVCFLVTTTKHALHQENETRMLSHRGGRQRRPDQRRASEDRRD